MADPLTRVHPVTGLFPAALILRGSVVQRVVWGVTRRHAIRRANRIAKEMS